MSQILGTGIDIIEIDRIHKTIARRGDRFLKHIYTSDEAAYCLKHQNPYPHFAARFAAKEAIFKALGRPGVYWQDIEILQPGGQVPRCRVNGLEADIRIHLSISHSKHYAIAQALVTRG